MQTLYTFSYTPAVATGSNTTGTNWRMAYQQPIMLYKGTANTIKIVVFATTQRVVNLTNYNVQIQIVDKETEEHYVTRTATITAPTTGVASVTFTEADLRNLENRFYHIIARLIQPGDGSSVTTSEILYLDDNYGAFAPVIIENAWNYQPTIISTENGVQVINFRTIDETPNSYAGQGGNILRVNSAANAIEFSNSVTLSSATIGNLLISNAISSTSLSLELDFGSQLLTLVDNSTDPNHNEGDGGFITFNDNTHLNDGPRFEIWYGNANATPYDPPGQHSLDIRAAENSYVEFASHDLNSFMGIDAQGPFIQTRWLTEPTKAWRFLGDGELRLPNVNSSITSLDGRLSVVMAYDDIRLNCRDNDGSTIHSTIFDTSGNVYVGGSLFPGGFDPDPAPIKDLGSPTHPWNDLYLSNSTIYLGDVALSVNENGNLLVDGNVITGGGGGEGLPTITVPAEAGSTYKGLQVSYGMIHSNNGNNELNVNKIVIHKPAVTTTTIDPTSSQDDFAVTGLGDSDVLVMFVLYGNVNGPKTLSTLQAFAEAAIDNVILDDGVAGDYNTVEQMKTAFYTNYSTLAAAAGGLDQDFTFFTGNLEATTGATTVRQGSGAVFEIGDNGLGAYTSAGIQSNGTNYLAGHKIKVLGTALGGVTPDNDCIITVDSISEGGLIFQWSVEGTAAGAVSAVYGPVTGTNYQTGSGFSVEGINPNNLVLNLNTRGSNYVADDQVTLPGSDLQNGTSPTNNIIIRILTVDGSGAVQTWEYLSGTVPQGTWPSNSISDGGNDQYDGANYINSSLANQISYNGGNTVVNGTAAFGTGSSYTFVYDTGIFGLLVTGNQSTSVSTSGNSGADGSSTTEAGNLYGPDTAAQTFDNAVTHINLIGNPYAGAVVSFTHSDNGDEVDILIPDDGSTLGVGITRDNNNGIYNPYSEGSWDSDVSPGGTLWNIDGWADFSDVESRTYAPLYEAFGFGGLGNKIVGTECVMYLPDNGKYYAVKFSAWTQNNNGGGFAYTRRELDLTSLSDGIRFSDGTRLKSAEGLSRVKLESPGARRIEEAHGFKIVSVTSRTTATAVTSTAALGNELALQAVTIVVSGTQLTTLNALVNSGALYYFEVSLNQTNWFRANWGGSGTTGGSQYFQLNLINGVTLPVSQGATVYYRITTGGDPAVWWDKNELPAGGGNFRGAVIDYHAYTSDGTIIGTIHIVDDSGEEFITHTEVSSGGTDLENDDLWFVQNEGTISYRRIDGAARTLKVQWTAKVFYGSEIYD
jgi:hypothetical protein